MAIKKICHIRTKNKCIVLSNFLNPTKRAKHKK